MSQHLNYSESIPSDQLREIHTFHKLTDGMISLEEGLVLYTLAGQVASGCIVEVGSPTQAYEECISVGKVAVLKKKQ